MSAEVEKQFCFLFLSFAWGMGMCWIYDGLIIFRKIVPHSRRWRDLEDLIYWLCMTAQSFYLLFTWHRGEIRSYIVAGLIAGSLFYVKMIRLVYQTMMMTVLYPVRWFVKKLSIFLRKSRQNLRIDIEKKERNR